MNRRTTRTTIFFATDVHGSERCFIKFINAAKFYQANVLILGGDITGKALVPIVRQAGSTNYTANFLGQAATLVENLRTHEHRIHGGLVDVIAGKNHWTAFREMLKAKDLDTPVCSPSPLRSL